jgi:hypothetical protein
LRELRKTMDALLGFAAQTFICHYESVWHGDR